MSYTNRKVLSDIFSACNVFLDYSTCLIEDKWRGIDAFRAVLDCLEVMQGMDR